MNLIHRWGCRSGYWAKTVQRHVIPWTLDGVELGDDALEIGPGPGLTTDVLRTMVARLTCVEIDRRLVASLATRLDRSNVKVVEGDATDMPFPDGSFSGAVSLTMLHHVPTPELQDRLLAEVNRVLKPGGWFAGTDSMPNLRWRIYHLFDTCVPVDPDTFAERLRAAGFEDVLVDANPWAFRFRGRKPATTS